MFTPLNVIRRTKVDNAAFVVDQIRTLGYKPSPTCRLMQMHRALSRGQVPFEDPEFPIALEAERDMQQLGFIFDHIQIQADNQKFQKLIKELVLDCALPQNDLERSPGRDAQFELYLASVCQNAGMVPVDYSEPDVRCVTQGTTFMIEGKRIKNETNIRHRIKKAAEQIGESKTPGIIALDMSFAWNRKNMPVISRVQMQLLPLILQLQGGQFFDKYATDIYRWVEGKGVLAVVVFNFRIRLSLDNEWGLEGMMTWLDTSRENEEAKQKYKIFYEQFLRGVPNVKNAAEA